MKIIDDATLQRLEELEKRATKGPWFHNTENLYEVFSEVDPISDGREVLVAQLEADAGYIAASRNALPLLLDSVRRLKEALALAQQWIDVDGIGDGEADMARIRELVGE